jgi:membrane peptidoglycan carboxypeptidase
VTPEVAAQLRQFLAGAVGEGGTGERAQLANYSLIGKTGTALRFVEGRYVQGSYCASFAAVFPAEDPQLVAIVKLDDPKGRNFGGETAAPLTKSMLQEALAANRSAIDRSKLAAGVVQDTTAPVAPARPEKARTVVVAWPAMPDTSVQSIRLPVPDVKGTNLRRAAYALHRRGFQVAVHGSGKVSRTTPAAGDSLATGRTVTVWAE